MKQKKISAPVEIINHAIETLEMVERLEHREKSTKSLRTVIQQLKDVVSIMDLPQEKKIR